MIESHHDIHRFPSFYYFCGGAASAVAGKMLLPTCKQRQSFTKKQSIFMTSFRTGHRIIFLLILIALMAQACSPMRQVAELSQRADAAYESGNFEEAHALYAQLIDAHRAQNQEIDGLLYQRAGLAAHAVGDTQQAIEYLEFARHRPAADKHTFFILAKAYREIDNLSREISNLERYARQFPDGKEIVEVRERLFITLVESLNWQQAYDLWPDLGEKAFQNEKLMTAYLQVTRRLDDNDTAYDIAEMLLALNANNTEALDYLGRKHFNAAVSRHNREMRAYEENRTHRQYAQLLEAFEIINTDFRIALNYFQRLYEQDPRPEYASFLANIYERFQDEEKARYYRQKAN